jgi:hypothetical protein
MGWDIFMAQRKGRRGEPDDELQIVINSIEQSSPKRFLQEREMYYYHYRQINKYFKPLLALLIYISEAFKKKENEEIFIQGLFRKLKDFYDVNEKLSMKEAIHDYSLKVKLLTLLKIFYNDTRFTEAGLEGYLKKIEDNEIN